MVTCQEELHVLLLQYIVACEFPVRSYMYCCYNVLLHVVTCQELHVLLLQCLVTCGYLSGVTHAHLVGSCSDETIEQLIEKRRVERPELCSKALSASLVNGKIASLKELVNFIYMFFLNWQSKSWVKNVEYISTDKYVSIRNVMFSCESSCEVTENPWRGMQKASESKWWKEFYDTSCTFFWNSLDSLSNLVAGW